MNEELVINYHTHGVGNDVRAHQWRYLGRKAQAYVCTECRLRVTKAELKEATDSA